MNRFGANCNNLPRQNASGSKGSQISAIAGVFEGFWSLGWVKMTHTVGRNLTPLILDPVQAQNTPRRASLDWAP
jgi:hypothetical protein